MGSQKIKKENKEGLLDEKIGLLYPEEIIKNEKIEKIEAPVATSYMNWRINEKNSKELKWKGLESCNYLQDLLMYWLVMK